MATKCGFDGEELKHAQLALKQLSDAKKNTKEGVLARSKDMNYDSMVEEQSKVFKVAQFAQLRSRDGSSLVFSKSVAALPSLVTYIRREGGRAVPCTRRAIPLVLLEGQACNPL